MKYLKGIILALAIIISVIWIEVVYADMSGPELREFEIVVINPDGVDYYDYKDTYAGHLNKDEIVLVLYEYDGKYTLGTKKTTTYGVTNDILGYVKNLEGFSIVQEEIDPTKLTDDETIIKYDTARKAKVYTEDGVDVYAGPSTVYKKVGHIKNKTVLSYKYSTQGTHIYVEYNGIKGWIEILKGKVLVQNEKQFIFEKDVTTECGTIPRNSITTPTYTTDRWTHQTLFEYNGCEFLHNSFRDDEIYSFYSFDRKTSKDVTVYEYADTSSKVLSNIPSGTRITVLADNDYPMSEDCILYVEYNGVRGWILSQGEVLDYGTSELEPEEEPKIEDTIDVKEPEEVKPTQYEKKPGLSLPELIALCSMGGVLLIVTAIVIIILINKNKANKTNE